MVVFQCSQEFSILMRVCLQSLKATIYKPGICDMSLGV